MFFLFCLAGFFKAKNQTKMRKIFSELKLCLFSKIIICFCLFIRCFFSFLFFISFYFLNFLNHFSGF